MIRELQVRAVREALWAKSTPDATAERSTALLGSMFHEIAAALTRRGSPHHVAHLLEDAPIDPEARRGALISAVYQHLVGPRLAAAQAQLGGSSAEVLSFWTAVQALVAWLVRLADAAVEEGRRLSELQELFASEEPVRVRLRDARWTSEVEVSGVMDLVLRVPDEGQGAHADGCVRWCVVELKLGRGALEADLGQAALYHLLLAEGGAPAGSLALVSFTPERREHLLEEPEVKALRPALLDLVARLAGVLRADGAPEVRSPEHAAPPPPRGADAATASDGAEGRAAEGRDGERDAHAKSGDGRSGDGGDGAAAALARAQELGRRLTSAYREYGVETRLGAPILGPTFIRFPVDLGRGQQVPKLNANVANVQVRLGLADPPLISVESGRLTIDVARADRRLVTFASVRDQILAAPEKKGALLPVGVDLSGRLRFADLGDAFNCHLLVAGTTGSGKSEWLRFALAGLALRHGPDDVRFILIDPKRTAFHELRGSPYLYGDRGLVFPNEHPVVEILAELAEEMERRYALFEAAGADDLASYRARTGTRLARVLLVCDEYFDLVAGGGKEQKAIESAIARLGAKARAAGIHLVLAMQQPSRQVIRGVIDANIPCRVGLKTSKVIESQMLLKTPGAEALLGNGDLLFKDAASPVRLQAPLTTREDRQAIFHPGR